MKQLIYSLKAHNCKISVAESCTGGMAAKLITDISGASEVFECGVVAYSDKIKTEVLGVSAETLEKYTAVSEETAIEMAKGVLKLGNSDIAISTTGIAGPKGDASGKPVGTVCIGIATKENSYAKTFVFAGSRGEIRRSSAKMALSMALLELGEMPKREGLIAKVKDAMGKKQHA